MLRRIANWLVKRSRRREPDFVIHRDGEPCLLRWRILPSNWLGNIYVHRIVGPDPDTVLHDHPWFWASYIVKGMYAEITDRPQRLDSQQNTETGEWITVHEAGSLRVRSPWFAHRLVPLREEVWTVFVVGPRLRVWGFYTPGGWRPWREYVRPDDKGQIGKGCE